jgi:hypothetical protein
MNIGWKEWAYNRTGKLKAGFGSAGTVGTKTCGHLEQRTGGLAMWALRTAAESGHAVSSSIPGGNQDESKMDCGRPRATHCILRRVSASHAIQPLEILGTAER